MRCNCTRKQCNNANKWIIGTQNNVNEFHKHNVDEKSFTTKELNLHNRTQEKIIVFKNVYLFVRTIKKCKDTIVKIIGRVVIFLGRKNYWLQYY